MIMDTNKSTSRRQGRLREEGSGGSRSAKVRADGQKPHIRLSPWASRHHTSEAHRFGGRVNAAVAHGKFTFLSGEICASRDRRFMSKCRNGFIRFIKYPAYLSAVDRYDSLSRETQSIQRLISFSIAPFVETRRVSTQKSAEGIVVVGAGSPCPYDKGLNVEMRKGTP
jgi:hypothetical protein